MLGQVKQNLYTVSRPAETSTPKPEGDHSGRKHDHHRQQNRRMLQRIDDKWVCGEYLNFKDEGPVAPGRPTHIFSITSRSNGALLGRVKWYAPWRKYVSTPFNAIFDETCHREIADFLKMATDEHRARRKQ